MKRRKILAIFFSVLMLVSLLAACGPKEGGGGDPTNTDTFDPNAPGGPGGGVTNSPGGNVTPDDTIVSSKDTVVFGQTSEPLNFVIGNVDYSNTPAREGIVIYNIYDSLLWMNWDGSIDYMLATGYTVSADGMEYIFTLRDDVYFHNGYKLTAEDVAFTLNYGIKNSPGLAANNLMGLASAEAIDDLNVKMIMSIPYAAFPNCLTSRMALIMSKQYFDEVGLDGYRAKPIGTGAYKFDNQVLGQSTTLKANHDYWNGAPYIETIIIKPLENVTTQFLALENGEIDIIGTANINQCKQLTSPDLTWGYVPSSDRNSIFFHCGSGITQDKNIRKAIQCAIDKEEIMLGAIENYGFILDQDILQTYNDCPPAKDLDVVERDIEKAKEYLKAANYNGEELIFVASGATGESIATMVQGQLKAIGMNITIQTVDSATHTTLIREGTTVDIVFQSHASTLMDVSTLQFHYKLSATSTPRFPKEWIDKTTDLINRSDAEMDPVKRQALIAEILNMNTEEAWLIPLYNGVMASAWNKGVKGMGPHLNGIVYQSRLWYWE